jgi:hypothetical protein
LAGRQSHNNAGVALLRLQAGRRKEEGQPDDNYGSARYTSCTVLHCTEINGSDGAVSAIERKTVAALPLSRRMPICYLSLPLDRIASEFANCTACLRKACLTSSPSTLIQCRWRRRALAVLQREASLGSWTRVGNLRQERDNGRGSPSSQAPPTTQ